ncbi:hypothetical protein O3P69_016051 [Scylla paramamosain]|uniref:Uncharacterized protein n=1 Tax=Scylla paramamosain TaxID=85552 RepID=A0AAW0TA28_SCYPA
MTAAITTPRMNGYQHQPQHPPPTNPSRCHGQLQLQGRKLVEAFTAWTSPPHSPSIYTCVIKCVRLGWPLVVVNKLPCVVRVQRTP